MKSTVPPTFVNGKYDCSTLTHLLGLSDFIVVDYEVDEENGRWILFCEQVYPADICPECLHVSEHVYQYQPCVVRDLPVFGLTCYLLFQIRYFYCEHCGKLFTERLDAVDFDSGYTRRYEARFFRERHSNTAKINREKEWGYKTAANTFWREMDRKKTEGSPSSIQTSIDEIA